MIRVFVREVQEIVGYKLGEFYPEDLPVLVARFSEYPTYVGDAGVARLAEARFICDDDGACFEILVETQSV